MPEQPEDKQLQERLLPEAPLPDESRILARRLLLRVIALVSLGLLLSASLVGYYIDNLNRDAGVHTVESSVQSVSNSVQMIMLSSLAPKNVYLDRLFEQLPLESGILQVHLLSHDNIIDYSTAPQMVGKSFRELQAIDCRSCHRDRRTRGAREILAEPFASHNIRTVSVPIYNRAECRTCHDDGEPVRGFVIAEFPVSFLNNRLWKFRFGLMALLFTWMILFALLAYTLLQRYTFKPMQVTAQRLAHLAAGDFDFRPAQVQNDGFVGFVNRNIDFAAQRLQAVYDTMDARINEQTRDLRDSRAELETERNKLHLLLEHLPDGVLGLDADDCITFANDAVAALLQTPLTELQGCTASRFPLLVEFLEQWTKSGRDSQTESPREPIELHCGDLHLEFQAAAIESVIYGNLRVVVILDRTARQNMERAMARQERLAATGRLAAGVAHEIGNPLSAISSIVQLQQQSAGQGNPVQLDLICYHIERIGRIVRNLSELSSARQLDMSTVDLNTLVPRALDIAAYDPRAKVVRLESQLHPAALKASCRPDEVVQVTLNLILNALDAVQDVTEPMVEVCTELRGDLVAVLVSDNGMGIPAENQARIFEPFFTTKALHKGTGLGLSVAYRSVVEMGGTLEVQSKPDEGAIFTMAFPRSI